MSNEKLLTIKDLAEYLQLNEQTVYRNFEKWNIPCLKLGRAIRFDIDQVRAWVQENNAKKNNQELK